MKQKRIWTGGLVAYLLLLGATGSESEGEKTAKNGTEEVKLSEVAVAGAEPDENKWRKAETWGGTSLRVGVLDKIVKKFKKIPDKFAREKDVTAYNEEMSALVEEFRSIPFNGSYQSLDAKRMIDTWESELQGKYSGHTYNLLEAEIANIFIQYKNRVH